MSNTITLSNVTASIEVDLDEIASELENFIPELIEAIGEDNILDVIGVDDVVDHFDADEVIAALDFGKESRHVLANKLKGSFGSWLDITDFCRKLLESYDGSDADLTVIKTLADVKRGGPAWDR